VSPKSVLPDGAIGQIYVSQAKQISLDPVDPSLTAQNLMLLPR
jgi:hypothetical protein